MVALLKANGGAGEMTFENIKKSFEFLKKNKKFMPENFKLDTQNLKRDNRDGISYNFEMWNKIFKGQVWETPDGPAICELRHELNKPNSTGTYTMSWPASCDPKKVFSPGSNSSAIDRSSYSREIEYASSSPNAIAPPAEPELAIQPSPLAIKN
ncbi:hypothetical protein EDM02_00770 [Candidatus Cardinium hertigii]|jgi:hypothetical protein|uniref:Uncharacterized protein n=2 Tax=Candidatus Cardinium hertigii TaxID=247481 RepID=A0A3N2QD71_9BACT|nr:hypothetical protein EDM02_00770 [Candidatus Cardinium hertigii]